MGKASAPPAPDYAAAAKETAAGNLDAARYATQANRVNTYTPFGSLTYTNGQKFDQAGYDAALAKYNTATPGTAGTAGTSGTGGYASGVGGGQDGGTSGDTPGSYGNGGTAGTAGSSTTGNAPRREDFMSGSPDQWSSTVTLDPAQQKLLDQQNKTSLNLAGLQDSATSRVADSLSKPFDMSKVQDRLPMGTALDPSQLPGYRAMGDTYTARQPLSNPYDPNSAPKLSSYYNPQQDTNNATQAILSRVAPQLQRDKAAMDTQLANQGIVQGSEAYNNAQDQFGRQANDAYTQASLQGINLGMNQQAQNFGQSVQGVNTGMGQQGQMFGQTLQNAGFRQGEQGQQFNQTNTNYQNSAAQRAQAAAEQAQQFNQNNTNYQNSSAGRQQDIQEQAYTRSLPLNELNALRTGSQVTSPTFTNAPQQQTTGGPDMLGAANSQYNAALNATNAQNAGAGNFMSGIFGIGSAALGNPYGMFGLGR